MKYLAWVTMAVLAAAMPLVGGSAQPPATAMDEMPPHHHATLEPGAVSGESLYQLQLALETAQGTRIAWTSLRGRALLVTMFYSRCTSVCPLITAELQRIDSQLTPEQRAGTRIVMVSFDTERDTPAALKRFEALHHIDDPRWIVARTGADEARLLAAALGIRYRQLPDHSFNHSAVITLADADGVVRSRTTGIGAVDASFLDTLRAIAAAAAANRPDRG